MREILFRGKTPTGKWVEGYVYTYESRTHIVKETLALPPSIDPDGTWVLDDDEVLPETVGQFTGLLDKNGRRIFEGDILKKDPYLIVVFQEGGFCFNNEMPSGADRLSQERVERLYILGNIHDKEVNNV